MTERSLDKSIYKAPVRTILIARFYDEFHINSQKAEGNFVHHEDIGPHSEFQMEHFLRYSKALKERLKTDYSLQLHDRLGP